MYVPDHHNSFKGLDLKKGFKKPLPWIILLIIAVIFSALFYLDSQLLSSKELTGTVDLNRIIFI